MCFTPSLGDTVQVKDIKRKHDFKGVVIAYLDDKNEFLITCTAKDGFLKVNLDLMESLMFRDSVVTSKHYFSKYENQYACWVLIGHIDEIPEGMSCKICGDWAMWYTSNQADGSFICYACREDPYRNSY
jgi:hypothetical protein